MFVFVVLSSLREDSVAGVLGKQGVHHVASIGAMHPSAPSTGYSLEENLAYTHDWVGWETEARAVSFSLALAVKHNHTKCTPMFSNPPHLTKFSALYSRYA